MFPFSRTQCFFLIRFKAKQKLKMFMGETNFHEIILSSGFWGEKERFDILHLSFLYSLGTKY